MIVEIYKLGELAPTFTYHSTKGVQGTIRDVQIMFAVDTFQVRGNVLEVTVPSFPG